MTPDQATFLAEQYVSTMANEIPTTVKVLKAVPDSAWSYRPDEKSRTAGELAKHIAQSDVWFVEGVINGEYVFDKEKAGALLKGLGSTEAIVAYYEKAMPDALARVRAMPADDLTRAVSFFGMFTQPAVGFLSMANNHGIHHRGQLAAYLRAMGAKVPSIYGPSGDEPVTR
jgi:uncharacterized damage-inducible protein DinB